MRAPAILVLGIGNILLTDEGVGVHTIAYLRRRYRFSANVTLMDGGTLGLALLDPVRQADVVIVVDAMRNGHPPGTMYGMDDEELQANLTGKTSLHQMGILELLTIAGLTGSRPRFRIVGIEPRDIESWATELSAGVARRLPQLARLVLQEVRQAGGGYRPRRTALRRNRATDRDACPAVQ